MTRPRSPRNIAHQELAAAAAAVRLSADQSHEEQSAAFMDWFTPRRNAVVFNEESAITPQNRHEYNRAIVHYVQFNLRALNDSRLSGHYRLAGLLNVVSHMDILSGLELSPAHRSHAQQLHNVMSDYCRLYRSAITAGDDAPQCEEGERLARSIHI